MKQILSIVLSLLLLTAQISHADTVTYFINDALGSPVAAMDESGGLKWRESYTAFGETLNNPEQNKNDVGYTGHQKDDSTGLTYMQARYYDPVVGRFYGIDPVEYNADNPVMSFNRYLYVNNNPYKYHDPSGQVLILIIPLVEVTIALTATEVALVGAGVACAATDCLTTAPQAVYEMLNESSDSSSLNELGTEGVLSDGEGASEEEIENSSGGPTAGKKVTPKEREAILDETQSENDGKYKCWRCGYESENDKEFDIGHRNFPRSKGGNKHRDNLRCEGVSCNRSAGNRGAPKKGSDCKSKKAC